MQVRNIFQGRPESATQFANPLPVRALLQGYSIEVMPNTAAKIADLRQILPAETRVYVAHVEGTPIDDMVRTVKRIGAEGFSVMPHLPARFIRSEEELETWIRRYREEAGATQALLLAGGARSAAGPFLSSMDVLKTGLLERYGFHRLHVAGHPEGNRDIEPGGETRQMDAALRWKQDFAAETGAAMAIVTQFCFDSAPVLDWAGRLRCMNVSLPVHVGIAGPARLQTLLKFALSCGVGNSLRVLRRRARDAANLLRPFPPDALVGELAEATAAGLAPNIQGIHIFPFGGIRGAADWVRGHCAHEGR